MRILSRLSVETKNEITENARRIRSCANLHEITNIFKFLIRCSLFFPWQSSDISKASPFAKIKVHPLDFKDNKTKNIPNDHAYWYIITLFIFVPQTAVSVTT